MKKNFAKILICLAVVSLGNEAKAGLFDHDDKLPGEFLGYKQPCPVRKCTFSGAANGDLDLHMQKMHPSRYKAALDVYNRSTFSAFFNLSKSLYVAAKGGFGGTSGAMQEFYSALRKAGSDGRTIADILSSELYD